MATSSGDDDQQDDTSGNTVKQSKEWIQVKCAARETLEQSGWVDAVRHTCLMMMNNNAESTGIPKQSALVAGVQSDAKTRVPDHIKADILQKIKAIQEEDEEEKLRAGNQAYAALSQSIEKEAAEAVEHLQGTSLFLVGMMGTGKSTVGKMLGQALGYCFLDSDSLIEQLAGKSVADIFAEDGEEDFRVLETEVLQEIAPFARCVVATGGGAACKSQNWGHMQTGISIWLDGRPAMLAQRVLRDSSNDRPLVAIDGAETMSEEEIFDATVGRLEALLEARRSQYAYADLTVSLEGTGDDDAAADPATVVLRILTSLNARIRKDAKEREERKNFEIVNNDLPPSMRVVSNINQTAQDDPYMP